MSAAYTQWLRSRVASLKGLYQAGRLEAIGPLAADLQASAAAMGCEEVEAAARAVQRLVDNPGALDAAIEILRRIVNRAVRDARRTAA